LYLRVTGLRADGLHLLDSLVVFADVADRLSAAPAARLELRTVGVHGPALATEADNLVLRAARALASAAGKSAAGRSAARVGGADLVLEKNLPVASGIGGGSADAAAALRLLQRLWAVTLPTAELLGLAASLGADVPVCLARLPARMSGVGDVLQAAPAMPDFGMVLVNPLVAVSTAEVFRTRDAGFSPQARLPDAWPDAAAMVGDIAALGNDLEAAARRLCPAIGAVLAALRAVPGCRLARMSGSGATCFGIWDTPAAAREAAGHVTRNGWWAWGGGSFVP